MILYFIDVANVFPQISQSKLTKRALPVTCIIFINTSQSLYLNIGSTVIFFSEKAVPVSKLLLPCLPHYVKNISFKTNTVYWKKYKFQTALS